MKTIANYINNQLVAPQSGNYLPVYDPSTGQVYAQLPDSDEKDVQLAVAAAQEAFPAWSALPAEKRSQLYSCPRT